MIAEKQSPLRALMEWIRGIDAFSRRRLSLLQRVEQILLGQVAVTESERLDLANRLERWRYYFLDHWRWRPDAMSRRLADVLDLATNCLVGRQPRAPRCPHDAIGDSFTESEQLARAMQCLDPEVPLGTVAHRAAQVVLDTFSGPSPADSLVLQRRVSLYAPIQLTNYCVNCCSYCGGRHGNPIERTTISTSEVIQLGESFLRHGVRRVILTAGDFPRLMRLEVLKELIGELSVRSLEVWLEIAPQSTADYEALVEAGASRVIVHQEIYDDILYAHYHQRGIKRSYDWRLESLDRAAEAGCRSLGLGILLGLTDPVDELPPLVRHALYLKSRHPECKLCFSLPRIFDAPADFTVPHPVDDALVTRLHCALRIAFPDADILVSPREAPPLRNRLIQICATQLGACGCAMAGNYEFLAAVEPRGEHSSAGDRRTPVELSRWLHTNGFQVSP